MLRFQETPRLDDRSSVQGSIAPSTANSSQGMSIQGIGAMMPQGNDTIVSRNSVFQS